VREEGIDAGKHQGLEYQPGAVERGKGDDDIRKTTAFGGGDVPGETTVDVDGVDEEESHEGLTEIGE
jgi:hypothetical protein